MAVRRGGRSAFRGALNLLHSRGTRLYNVFHRCDPIAGKLEPLTLSRDARAPGTCDAGVDTANLVGAWSNVGVCWM